MCAVQFAWLRACRLHSETSSPPSLPSQQGEKGVDQVIFLCGEYFRECSLTIAVTFEHLVESCLAKRRLNKLTMNGKRRDATESSIFGWDLVLYVHAYTRLSVFTEEEDLFIMQVFELVAYTSIFTSFLSGSEIRMKCHLHKRHCSRFCRYGGRSHFPGAAWWALLSR